MYIFRSEQPRAIVWDGAENKMLCRFKNGICETDNEDVASKLRTLGYQEGGGEMALSELSKQQAQQAAQQKAEEETRQTAQQAEPASSPLPHSSTPEEQEPQAAPEIGPKRAGRPKREPDNE